MGETDKDLAKAASVTEHVNKMHKAHDDHHMAMAQHHEAMAKLHKGCVDHHMKMANLHKARHTEATGHFGTLKKMLGSEEIQPLGEGEPKPINPQSEATHTPMAFAASLSPDDVKKIVTETTTAVIESSMSKMVDATTRTIMETLLGPEKVSEALKVAGSNVQAAAGVGDRNNMVPPKVKVNGIVVTKADDNKPQVTEPEPKPEDAKVSEIFSNPAEALKFMKSAKATEVPATIASTIGDRFNVR